MTSKNKQMGRNSNQVSEEQMELEEEMVEARDLDDEDVGEEDEDEDNLNASSDDDEDEASDSEREAQPVKKKRGRPKGFKVGKRPVLWVCVEVVDGELTVERISSPAGSENPESFSAEEAKKVFEETYGVEPSHVEGPFRDFKNAKVAAKGKREAKVRFNLDDIRLGTERKIAIFDGWRGCAMNILDNPDQVFFIFEKPVDPANQKKRLPVPDLVPVSEIRELPAAN